MATLHLSVPEQGGGVSSSEQRSRARSRRGGVSENLITGSAVASLFFLTAIAIAIATRPFIFHENSVAYTSSSFVSSIRSLDEDDLCVRWLHYNPDHDTPQMIYLGGSPYGIHVDDLCVRWLHYNPDHATGIWSTWVAPLRDTCR